LRGRNLVSQAYQGSVKQEPTVVFCGKHLQRFLVEEDGPTATEYAVLVALIIVVAIIGITAHGAWMTGPYQAVNDAF